MTQRIKISRLRPHIWTVAEIQKLPEFGPQMGWFYGLVRDYDDGKSIHLAEIMPGMGYAALTSRDMRTCHWGRVLRDLWRYRLPQIRAAWERSEEDATRKTFAKWGME